METISKSSLGTFESCKRKYFYSLIGFKTAPNEYMKYGLDFHNIIEKYNKNLIKNDEKDIIVNEEYKGNLESYKKFLNELVNMGYKRIPYACEFPISYNQYFGFIDVIFSNDNGEYLIADFKTIPKFTEFSEDKYKLELTFYKYVFSNVKNIPLDKIKTALVRFEQKGFMSDFHLVDIDEIDITYYMNIAENMKNFINNSTGKIEEFPMVDVSKSSSTCKYCDYYKICK